MSNPPPSSFKTWLLQQSGRKDAVGEFARTAAKDPSFPNEATDARRELRRFQASDETMAACAEAIREYNLTI